MVSSVFTKKLFFVLATQFGQASSQVPSNYISLDQVDRQSSTTNSARASTYREGEERIQQPSVLASTAQNRRELAANSEDGQDVDNISNQPLGGATVTNKGIDFSGTAISALGSDPVRAYGPDDYPGIGRSSIQRVKDTQAQYAESLASQDIVNLLGHPFLKMVQGSGRCANGESGQLVTYDYLIREGPFPTSVAVVRFCADGMQSITTKSLR